MYPPTSQLRQLEDALEAARTHMLIIPPSNKLAQGIQKQIIARYEAQISELKGAKEWLN